MMAFFQRPTDDRAGGLRKLAAHQGWLGDRLHEALGVNHPRFPLGAPGAIFPPGRWCRPSGVRPACSTAIGGLSASKGCATAKMSRVGTPAMGSFCAEALGCRQPNAQTGEGPGPSATAKPVRSAASWCAQTSGEWQGQALPCDGIGCAGWFHTARKPRHTGPG